MHKDSSGTLHTTHYLDTPVLTGRGRHQFSRQQHSRARWNLGECRSSISAAFNNPAKRIIEPAQIINPACLHRASSCHIPTNSPKTHQTLIKQQIHKSIIHSLENPNPNSNNWHSTIQWAATPNPTTAPAPAPAAAVPATRPSPTDTTTSKPACKSSAS